MKISLKIGGLFAVVVDLISVVMLPNMTMIVSRYIISSLPSSMKMSVP